MKNVIAITNVISKITGDIILTNSKGSKFSAFSIPTKNLILRKDGNIIAKIPKLNNDDYNNKNIKKDIENIAKKYKGSTISVDKDINHISKTYFDSFGDQLAKITKKNNNVTFEIRSDVVHNNYHMNNKVFIQCNEDPIVNCDIIIPKAIKFNFNKKNNIVEEFNID